MGILRKAAVGTLIVGISALAIAKNQKPILKLKKTITNRINGVLTDGKRKSTRKLSAKKAPKKSK